MPEKIVQLNEEVIKGQIKELVRGNIEETLNHLLKSEAQKLPQEARYERNEQHQGYRTVTSPPLLEMSSSRRSVSRAFPALSS